MGRYHSETEDVCLYMNMAIIATGSKTIIDLSDGKS